MKTKSGFAILLIPIALLVFSNDTVLEKIGLKEPTPEQLSAEEMATINGELAGTEFAPLLLERVTLEKVDSDDPMHDTELVFQFNRPLIELERKGFGRRIYFKEPWRYSISLKGKNELADYQPLYTLTVDQYDESNLKLSFAETYLHPKPSPRSARTFAQYADATFRPGGLESFNLCLYQWQGFGGDGEKQDNLKMVAEWRMQDLEQVSETEWAVPKDFDPAPSPEALQYYEKEMDLWPTP